MGKRPHLRSRWFSQIRFFRCPRFRKALLPRPRRSVMAGKDRRRERRTQTLAIFTRRTPFPLPRQTEADRDRALLFLRTQGTRPLPGLRPNSRSLPVLRSQKRLLLHLPRRTFPPIPVDRKCHTFLTSISTNFRNARQYAGNAPVIDLSVPSGTRVHGGW